MRLTDVRNGGQGRREEGRVALITLLTIFNDPVITHLLLKLWAGYHGRWDLLNDLETELSSSIINLRQLYPDIQDNFSGVTIRICDDIWIEQIQKDKEALERKEPTSMCAKWIVTENKNI